MAETSQERRTHRTPFTRVVALAGGVGGARLAQGLAQCLADKALTVVVNTADDFEWLGLTICPDLDTVLYTLAGVENRKQGWGRAHDTVHALAALGQLGGPTWFRIGDRDLATHLRRSELLWKGHPLTEVTRVLAEALGVGPRVLPMSDDELRTRVVTAEGELDFQDYFVKRACEPRVVGFRFEGAETAQASQGVLEALAEAELVVVCPSNPYVSLDPILGLPGVGERVRNRPALAVSPIIGGAAVKGPAAKMMRELGREPSAREIARHYAGTVRGLVIDTADTGDTLEIEALGLRVRAAPSLMRGPRGRAALAQVVLDFGRELAGG
ncbi:MAG: 2-phospho-L-lactate transferase [Chloroflexi bacterium]|nr:2-phospho-L-lactate transferase [Chloroflexota bacterium]